MKTIYKIVCRVNDRVYVGQTKHFNIRKREHINDLGTNRHSNVYLLGRKAVYIPYKGKVKAINGEMIVVTKELYDRIMDLKSQGTKMVDISKITNIKYNGIYNIVNNKIYLPFKCND